MRPDWTALPSETKLAMIVDGFKADRSYAQMRDELGAPSNGAISSYVRRAREKGLLPPATRETLSQAGRLHARRRLNPGPSKQNLHPGNIARKADSRQYDPGLDIDRSNAFDPLPDTKPIPLQDLNNRTCRWPIECDEPGFFFCGAECEVERSYCTHHQALSRGAPLRRITIPVGA